MPQEHLNDQQDTLSALGGLKQSVQSEIDRIKKIAHQAVEATNTELVSSVMAFAKKLEAFKVELTRAEGKWARLLKEGDQLSTDAKQIIGGQGILFPLWAVPEAEKNPKKKKSSQPKTDIKRARINTEDPSVLAFQKIKGIKLTDEKNKFGSFLQTEDGKQAYIFRTSQPKKPGHREDARYTLSGSLFKILEGFPHAFVVLCIDGTDTRMCIPLKDLKELTERLSSEYKPNGELKRFHMRFFKNKKGDLELQKSKPVERVSVAQYLV